MNYVKWLHSCEYFGGYKFDLLVLDDVPIERAAKVIHEVVQHDDFCNALVNSVIAQRDGLQYQAESPDIFSAHEVSMARIGLTMWNGYQHFGRSVESLILRAFNALSHFGGMPHRTPSEHKKHYNGIADCANHLTSVLRTDGNFSGWHIDIAELESLAELATEIAEHAPLSRPNARNAARTFVAKAVSESFEHITGGYRHAASATLVNAMFPEAEPIDAGYMQSLVRSQ